MVRVVSPYGFSCISLMANGVEQLFMGLFATCTSSSVKCLGLSFAHFLTGCFVLLLLSFGREGLLGVGLCDAEEQRTQQARASSQS